MASTLSNLADDLLGGIHKLNVNMDILVKNVKDVELNTNVASGASDTQTLKMI